MKKGLIVLFSIFSVLASGCQKSDALWSRFESLSIPTCSEINANIHGERTGTILKCDNLVFYSMFTYRNMTYESRKEDGLYITDTEGTFHKKICDGIVSSISVREDGVYFLRLCQYGEVWLYNYDLCRYGFETKTVETIITNCTFVQYTEKGVLYCQQYLGSEEFFQDNPAYSLKHNNRIVYYSFLTGKEQIIIDERFDVQDFRSDGQTIAFVCGDGDPMLRGRELYVVSKTTQAKRVLATAEGEFVTLYGLYNGKVLCSAGINGIYSLVCISAQTGEIEWSFPWQNIVDVSSPHFFDDSVYFCKMDRSTQSYDEILCLSNTRGMLTLETQKSPIWCSELFYFDNVLYAWNSKDGLVPVT